MSAKKRRPKASLFWLYVGCILLAGHGLVGLGHFLEDTGVLLGHHSLDDQQGGDHQDNGDNHADHNILDQTGDDEADEGNGSHGHTVGDLRCHMVQVEAVGTGRSHDGGIGDGGQVVAAHAAGAGGSQTDGQQGHLGVPVKHSADQRDHDADGTPGGTGGEADEAGHNEDYSGQQDRFCKVTGWTQLWMPTTFSNALRMFS